MLTETIKGISYMNNYAIGVFDSGMGGLTAVKELNALMPDEDIIYFGDTARIPYGSRSRETVLKYAKEDVSFLLKHNIKMIIAACGTVSSVIGSKPLVDNMPFTGVILPGGSGGLRRHKKRQNRSYRHSGYNKKRQLRKSYKSN